MQEISWSRHQKQGDAHFAQTPRGGLGFGAFHTSQVDTVLQWHTDVITVTSKNRQIEARIEGALRERVHTTVDSRLQCPMCICTRKVGDDRFQWPQIRTNVLTGEYAHIRL